MASSRRTRGRPASSPAAREAQLISSAYDLAERQIEEGSASSQVITHFLKLGSSRERLEQERLHNENLLLAAKRESMESGQRIEAMYEEALAAMRTYSGQPVEEEDDYDEYYD